MQTRLLLGVLALGMPEEAHDRGTQETGIAPKGLFWSDVVSASKLHVGMLTISLIACLGFGAYAGFLCWTGKDGLLSHVRNLSIAFFCRVFFTILFDGVVILGNASVGGANTLLALECITQNLVFAFWLLLTVHLHAQLQRKFNSEPTLNLYEYAIPGVAVFFAFVWIFVLQAEFPLSMWWGFPSALPQWIVCSIRLLYLFVQLGLVVDMGRMTLKMSVDNDSVSLLRKSGGVLLGLVFLFWLQFGLSLGRLSKGSTAGYLHFDYFVDGSQGALVCLGLFFLQLWVSSVSDSAPSAEVEGTLEATGEGLPPAPRGIVTVDEVFMTGESGRWRKPEEEARDVVYSSVVEPERLKRTLDLYKRLNVLPRSEVTVVGGEEFFDCGGRESMRSGEWDRWDFHSVVSDGARTPPAAPRKQTPGKHSDVIQKRNAFYASKYLIVEPKGSEFPKDTTHSPRKECKGEGLSSLDTLMSDDLVNRWLNDHSGSVKGAKKPKTQEATGKPAERQLAERVQNEELTAEYSPTQIIRETRVEDFQSEIIRRPDWGGTAEPKAVTEATAAVSGESTSLEMEKRDSDEGVPEPRQRQIGATEEETIVKTADLRKDSHSAETHSTAQLPKLSHVISSTFNSFFNSGLFRWSNGATEVSAAADDSHATTVSQTEIGSGSKAPEPERQIYGDTNAQETTYSNGMKPPEKHSKDTKPLEKYSEEHTQVPEAYYSVEGTTALEKHSQEVPEAVEKYSKEDTQAPEMHYSDGDIKTPEKHSEGHTKPPEKYSQENTTALEKYSQDDTEVPKMYYPDEDAKALGNLIEITRQAGKYSKEDTKVPEKFSQKDKEVPEMYYSDEDTTALEMHSKHPKALKKLLPGDPEEMETHLEEAAAVREIEEKAPETPEELQVAVSITAVPVVGSENADNWSSDSNFSVDMENSSDSSFTLDKYYAGLKSVRARVDEHQHPYAQPAKRAKLRE